MTIRQYKKKDYRQLKKILEKGNLFVPHLDTPEILEDKITKDPESIIVAEEKGKLIGIVYFIYDPWASSIFHLAVHPDFRNRGIGSELLDTAERILKGRGTSFVGVYIDSKDLSFYQKRNYEPFGMYLCMEKKI